MKRLLSVAILVALMCTPVFAQSIPILAPGDAIIAIDADGHVSNSRTPGSGNEDTEFAIDAYPDPGSGTKYLNFAKEGTGFIVTPTSPVEVQSFQMATANDAWERDPATWELWGTNDAITSADNSTGLAENWTLIDAGDALLSDDRFTLGPITTVSNSAVYSSYKMMYPTIKNPGGTNSMQIADVQLFGTPDGSGGNLLDPDNSILAVHVGWDSSYPGGEVPAFAIDGDPESKYLNFGEENSGFIVTPSIGLSMLDSFQITTANDSPERDPLVWVLYGTNDGITSVDNSDGSDETWTLIAASTMALPDDRKTLGERYIIANQLEEYTSYKMLFPTVKDAGAANSMQIAELQFYGIPEPATICLLGLGGLSLLRRRRS